MLRNILKSTFSLWKVNIWLFNYKINIQKLNIFLKDEYILNNKQQSIEFLLIFLRNRVYLLNTSTHNITNHILEYTFIHSSLKRVEYFHRILNWWENFWPLRALKIWKNSYFEDVIFNEIPNIEVYHFFLYKNLTLGGKPIHAVYFGLLEGCF